MVGMGVRSLSPGGTSEFVLLQTLRRVYIAVERAQTFRSHPTNQLYLFTAFKGLLYLLDLERSQKVDLEMCRFQGPIRSLSLEGKGWRRVSIGVIAYYFLSRWKCHQPSSAFIGHQLPAAVGYSDVAQQKSNNETWSEIDALSTCTTGFFSKWT